MSTDLTLAANVIPAGMASATTWRVHGVKTPCGASPEVNWIIDRTDPLFADKSHWGILIDALPALRLSADLVDTPADGVRTKPEPFVVVALARDPKGMERGMAKMLHVTNPSTGR